MIEKNLEILKNFQPEIYNEVINHIEIQDKNMHMEKVFSKSGYANLLVEKDKKKIYLHSIYSPMEEAKKWLKEMEEEEEFIIIIGGGYYYHIDALLKRNPNKKIIVLEPSKSIFISALKTIDMKKYFGNDNNNILFILSDNTYGIAQVIAQVMINKGIQRFDVLSLMSYKELFSDFDEEVKKSIYEILKTLRCNISTEYIHSQKWIYNNFRNLQKTNIESVPLSPIFGEYKNMPALIVSAGPSLEKQLQILKENEKKFFIIAAGSAVNVLERNNIIPHIVVAVDGEEIQDNIFKNIKSDKISLVYSHTFRYSSLEMFKGKKLWIKGNADSSVDYFEKYIGLETNVIEFGPSCANEAMDVARNLGCNPLIFIGQDLAYTNEQLYSKGAVHDLDMKTDIGDRIITKDMYGKEITTKTAFLVMKSYFENYIKQHNEVKYINCTEGGLNIEGMENVRFKVLISRLQDITLDVFKNINFKYEEIYTKLNKSNIQEKTQKFIELVKKECEKIEEKGKERIEKVKKLLGNLDELDIPQIQEEVKKINGITENMENNEVHKEIIYPIIAAYNLAVRQNIYRELENIENLKEKNRLLLTGLEKQYLYYQIIVEKLIRAVHNEDF